MSDKDGGKVTFLSISPFLLVGLHSVIDRVLFKIESALAFNFNLYVFIRYDYVLCIVTQTK